MYNRLFIDVDIEIDMTARQVVHNSIGIVCNSNNNSNSNMTGDEIYLEIYRVKSTLTRDV